MQRCLTLFALMACAHNPQKPAEVQKPKMMEPTKETENPMEDLSEGVLKNGLRWVFAPRPRSGVVAVQAWVGVGSIHEQAGEEGMAHLHEHMLFKRTENLAPGDLDRRVAELGGEVNAWTSYDETVYHLLLPASAYDEGLRLLREMVMNARFNDEDLHAEKEVVVEEIRDSEDDPGQRLSRRLMRQAYGSKHPLAREIAGTVGSVQAMNTQGVERFYRKHYHPEAVVLTVAGDLDQKQFFTGISEQFGAWSAPPRPVPVSLPIRQSGEAISLSVEPVAESLFSAAFPVDSLERRDRVDLYLLALAIGQGDSSRLLRALQYDESLANGLNAYFFDPQGPGLFTVSVATDQARLLEAIQRTLVVLGRLRNRPLSTLELERARRQVLLHWRGDEETAEDHASRLGHFRLHRGHLQAAQEDLEWVQSATPKRLQDLARKLFQPANLVLAATVPRGGTPELAQVHLESAVSGAWLRLDNELQISQKLPAPDAQGRVLLTLPSGVKLALEHRAGSGIFAMHAAWEGGALLEGASHNGLHHLMAASQTEGTESLGELALARRLDDLGASLVAQAGRNSYSLSIEGLTEGFEESLELFLETLKHPRFDDRSVDRERLLALESIRSRDDRPGQRAFHLAAKSLFGAHPYGRPLGGSEETLRHLSAQNIRSFYHEHYGQMPPAIMIAGDFDPSLFVERMQAAFVVRPEIDKVSRPKRPDLVLQTSPEKAIHLPLPREQIHLLRLYPAPAMADDQLPELLLVAELLGGQSGRLFQALREQKGLVYSVSSTPLLGLQAGALSIYCSTAPEQLSEVKAALDHVLHSLQANAPEAEELQRAQQSLVAGYKLRHQASSDRARSGSLDLAYGLGLDWEDRLQQRLLEVQPEQIVTLARRLFANGQGHEVLVGPPLPKTNAETEAVSMALTP